MNSSPRVTPGFVISMAGLSEFPFALAVMFLIDEYLPMEPMPGNISLGQWVAGIMLVVGTALFFYGRWLGWKPRLDGGGPVKRQ